MIHSCFRRQAAALLVGIVVFCLTVVWGSSAQTGVPTPFSGRVIDKGGNPIVGRAVAIIPVEDGNGAWFPIEVDGVEWPDDPFAFQAKTDMEGRFSISALIQGPVMLGLLPYYKPEAAILKVKIGEVFAYPSGNAVGRGIVFTPEPGEALENIEMTARPFLQVQGKVRRMDGTPLDNARIKFSVRQLGFDGESDGDMSWGTETDVVGDFGQYIESYTDGPAFYIMSIRYQGQHVAAKPIVVKPEDQTHKVIFTFKNPLMSDLPERAPRNFQAGVSAASGAVTDARGVWIVNPANGHAYKKIFCLDPEDAIAQATIEGAYLVAINDEAEQYWLGQVFTLHHTFIRLNNIEKEGQEQWQWHSGEPVTYTNWNANEPGDSDKGVEDYVILLGGQWMDIGPGDIHWRLTRTAILEREKPPVEK
ncbi:hypothetical protein F4009_16720 [Candidatus Poribacteria bacterium]|nr:hypothetical protein [Candidatus Poribacteria bacterium]MYH79103.1 hypothetical protein [Candidatus Poribacteria bacterium]MYK95614.1 hypothetical protein [Candidatus Poribacteria bacterium]